jgi:drug/metabolite transporter (DMT)-like permease
VLFPAELFITMKNGIQNNSLSLKVALFTGCLCAVFGSNAVAIKIALTGIGAFTLAGLRFGIACMCIATWAICTGRSLVLTRKQLFHMIIISIIFLFQFSLFHLGISMTNASRATIVVNSQPFFLLVLAHLFIPGDRITVRKITGMVLGFAGVAVLLLQRRGVTSNLQMGDFLVLCAAFLWACNMTYVKRVIHTFHPFQVTFYSMLFALPFFFLGGYLFDERMIVAVDVPIIAALLFASLIVASFGFVAWNTLLQKYGAVSLHSFVFIMPVSGVLFSGLILGDPVTGTVLLSLVLLISGIMIVHSGMKHLAFMVKRAVR